MKFRTWAFVLMTAVVGAPGVSRGEAPARDKAGAEALFDQGRKLLDQGQFAEACQKFAASLALEPAVGALLNLGDCHERQGHLASAWGHYHEATALARARGDGSRERFAHDRAARLEARLARLTVTVAPSSPRNLVVRRDGIVLDPAAIGAALPIDVGTHVVEATAHGRVSWRRQVDIVRDGDAVAVEIPVLSPIAPEPPTAGGSVGSSRSESAVTQVAAHDDAGLGTQRQVALVLGGVGVAGLAIGTLYGLKARSEWNDVRGRCDATGACDDAVFNDAAGAQRNGNVATVAAVAGGALVGVGAVLWLTAPERASRVGITPSIGPSAATFSLAGAF